MRHQGKITTWKDDQGFGFITPNLGGKEVFVHIKAFANRGQRPALNQIVSFELDQDHQGRPRALQVRQVGHAPAVSQRTASSPSNRGPIFVVAFMLALGLATLLGKLPHHIANLYLAASLIAFVAYAWDKSAAQRNRWRTRESTLHLLALIGGWPGALLAQSSLRHKSSKPAFQLVFRATVLLNCLLFAFLLTPQGQLALRSALHLS
jgi:uncharacterized membrane protein YsdA (DUF1294 family)/cold shock CspA family protein